MGRIRTKDVGHYHELPAGSLKIAGSSYKQIILALLKVGISFLLVFVLFYKIGFDTIYQQMIGANPWLISLAVGLILFSNLIQAWQWHLLLKAQEVYLEPRQIVTSYLAGIFFNNFLPANIGGEVIKIYDVSRKTGKTRAVFAATFFDRLIGMLVLTGMAVIFSTFILRMDELNNELLIIVGVIFAAFLAMIAATALMLSNRFSQWIVNLFNRLTGNLAAGKVQSVRDAIYLYRNKTGLLRRLIPVSLIIQFLRIFVHYLVARALGIDHIMLLYFLIFIPILGVLMLLPISFSGFGVREGVGIVLFNSIGVHSSLSVPIEFIAGILNIIAALIGGAVFLLRSK